MADRPLVTARDVSEHLLERTGRAMSEGDAAAFVKCFLLPQELDSFIGRRRIETADEVRVIFEGVREHYASLGVTSVVRNCVDAAFTAPDTVEATHETRLLCGDRLVQAPFPVFSILKKTNGDWQITFTQYAIADAPAHNAALCGSSRDAT